MLGVYRISRICCFRYLSKFDDISAIILSNIFFLSLLPSFLLLVWSFNYMYIILFTFISHYVLFFNLDSYLWVLFLIVSGSISSSSRSFLLKYVIVINPTQKCYYFSPQHWCFCLSSVWIFLISFFLLHKMLNFLIGFLNIWNTVTMTILMPPLFFINCIICIISWLIYLSPH